MEAEAEAEAEAQAQAQAQTQVEERAEHKGSLLQEIQTLSMTPRNPKSGSTPTAPSDQLTNASDVPAVAPLASTMLAKNPDVVGKCDKPLNRRCRPSNILHDQLVNLHPFTRAWLPHTMKTSRSLPHGCGP